MESGTKLHTPFELFGIECGKGWYPLFYPIIAQIELYNSLNKNSKVQITQIKEKFGGLCFYTTGVPDKIHKMITKAERDSYYTCEFCGTKKNIGQTKGWIITCCENCISNTNYTKESWKKIKPKWWNRLKNWKYNQIDERMYQIKHKCKKIMSYLKTENMLTEELINKGYIITTNGNEIEASWYYKPDDEKPTYTKKGTVRQVHKQIFHY